eukprot:5040759-Pyramimonas_sp.AAC.1
MPLGKHNGRESERAIAALLGHHELMHRDPDLVGRAVALVRSQGRPGVEDPATRVPIFTWKLTVELLMGDLQGLEELQGHLTLGVLRVAEWGPLRACSQ